MNVPTIFGHSNIKDNNCNNVIVGFCQFEERKYLTQGTEYQSCSWSPVLGEFCLELRKTLFEDFLVNPGIKETQSILG